MAPPALARRSLGALLIACLALLGAGHTVRAQEASQRPREITVTARNYEYAPPRIDVTQDDVLKITLVAEDTPHSFTIDAYRIAKRAAPGQPVTFEFRADRPGSFTYYCNLTTDDGCRNMRGELVVAPRRH